MNVSGWSTDDEKKWTTPYPTGLLGAKIRLLRGDVMYPHIGGPLRKGAAVTMRAGREGETPNWFNCVPQSIHRAVVGYRPFFSFGIGSWGLYAGWKVYGVDSDAYADWPGVSPGDVYTGSRAMCGTFRLTTSRKVT